MKSSRDLPSPSTNIVIDERRSARFISPLLAAAARFEEAEELNMAVPELCSLLLKKRPKRYNELRRRSNDTLRLEMMVGNCPGPSSTNNSVLL